MSKIPMPEPTDEFDIPIVAHIRIGKIRLSPNGKDNPVAEGLEMVAEWVRESNSEHFDVDFRVGLFVVSINSQEVPNG